MPYPCSSFFHAGHSEILLGSFVAGADRTHPHGQLDGLVWLEVFLTYSGNRYHSFARIQLGLGHGGHSVLKGGGLQMLQTAKLL